MNQNNNLDPKKYISCAGCSKPAHLRRNEEGALITPYKGLNGEELCHKCAPCAKCGKKDCKSYESGFRRSEKTNDNPSGEWELAYCSIECFNGTEKPNLPKSNFNAPVKCDHCAKLSEIRVGNASWGKNFCSTHCYELAFARLPSTIRDEISARCCVCSFRIFQDG